MSYPIQLRDYWLLFQLARKRLDSPKAYQEFQKHQGRLLARYLVAHQLKINGNRILDVGCGFGGYSFALRENEARVVAADLSALHTFGKFPMVRSDALALPFSDNSMDGIVCASLIEHVKSPANMLQELYRVVRRKGWVYLSFPPFYTPIGGHQFSPYHLFGERFAVRMQTKKHLFHNRHWLEERYPQALGSYAEAWGDWGLYPLKIADVEKIIDKSEFQILERSTRWSPVNVSGIPWLREFLTWHVQFLLIKDEA